jgi:flagellar biosynthesis component FlhA
VERHSTCIVDTAANSSTSVQERLLRQQQQQQQQQQRQQQQQQEEEEEEETATKAEEVPKAAAEVKRAEEPLLCMKDLFGSMSVLTHLRIHCETPSYVTIDMGFTWPDITIPSDLESATITSYDDLNAE